MIRDLILNGTEQIIKEGNEAEAKKVGYLRAGTTGMITPDGRIVGQCAGQAYLRFKGINNYGKPITIDKQLMFSGGQMNEDIWLDTLKKVYDGPILCETEIPTCWETENGVKVTGRPDIVLCSGSQDKPSPHCGIELKQVMSANTAYQVLFNKQPQMKHILQATHYMWQLDCPFELWYTNRTIFEAPDWLKFNRTFPKPGDYLSEHVGYRYYEMGDINPRTGKKIKSKRTEEQYHLGGGKYPFVAEPAKISMFLQGYKLKLDEEGTVWYCDAMHDNSEWIKTIVTVPGIERFYNYITEMDSIGKVPKEALNLTPTGEKIGWSFKDYSDLGDLDAGHHAGANLENWMAEIKKRL